MDLINGHPSLVSDLGKEDEVWIRSDNYKSHVKSGSSTQDICDTFMVPVYWLKRYHSVKISDEGLPYKNNVTNTTFTGIPIEGALRC